MLEFGEWLPDFGVLENPGSTEAKNVISTSDGYHELPSLAVNSTAINSYCRGFFAAQSSAGTSFQYCGSGSKLYQMSSGTWTDQSKASGTYTVNATESWEFAKWAETVIAVPGLGDAPQVITMGGVGGTEFANLGGTPPKARHISVVRDFVVLGNLNESGTNYPQRIRWSGINDAAHWTTSSVKQADYQDLKGEGGKIQSIRGGEYGVILEEHSIWRMDYVGPPVIFSLSETLPGIGTPAPNSVVQWGDTLFMLSQQGFGAIVNGSEWRDLSSNKITDWFFSRADMTNAHRIVGAIDYQNRHVYWIFPGPGNSDGLPNEGIVMDIDSGRWSHFEAEIEWIRNALGEATTLESLNAISASIDDLMISLDSRLWQGGAITLIAFDSAHKSGTLSGTALDAVIETMEKQAALGRRSMNTRIRPEIDGASSITVAPGSRDSQSDAVTWGSPVSEERDQGYPIRVDARYHRLRCNISGGFTRARGVSVVEGAPTSRG